MKVKVTTSGFRELEQTLSELTSHVTRRNVAKRALTDAAMPIAVTAEALAPARDGGDPEKHFGVPGGGTGIRRKGALKTHINIGEKLSKRQASLNRRAGKSDVEVHVGTRDRVGRLAEFGTRTTRAYAFMRRAWAQHGGFTALGRIRTALTEEISKAAARAARRGGSKR